MNPNCAIRLYHSFPLSDLSSNCLFLKIRDLVLLCVWKIEDIFIRILRADGSYSNPQVFKVNRPVVAILRIQDLLICVDSTGSIYKIVCHEDAEDQSKFKASDSNASGSSSPILGTGNLREDSRHVSFKIIRSASLSECEEALYVSPVEETKQIAVLSRKCNKFFFLLFDFTTMGVTGVCKIPSNVSGIASRKCLVKSWHSRNIDAQLKNILFPSLQAAAFTEFFVFIVALSNGSVLWLTSNNFSQGFKLLHPCYQSIAAIEFISTGACKTLNALCIVLDGGTVLLLSSLDRKLAIKSLFLPAAAKTAYSKSDGSILSSDFTDCFHSTISASRKETCLETTMLSVKGVIKFTEMSNKEDSFILASTKQNFVYKISIKDIEPMKVSKNFLPPKKDLLKDLMSTSNTLDNLLKQIQEEDERLAAISVAARADMLHQFFNVSVKVHSGPASVKYGSVNTSSKSHAFIIKIENKCDFYEFSPKLWLLSVSLDSVLNNDKNYHKIIKLEQLFKLNSFISVFFPVILNLSLPDLSLKVSLISKQSYGTNVLPWLIIPVKNMAVNLLYFLTPLKNPVLSNAEKSSNVIEAYLEKLSSLNATSTQMHKLSVTDSCQLIYFVKIPEDLLDSRSIFSILLNYSKYRCKGDVWNCITDSKTNCFALLSEKLIHFSVDGSYVRLQASGVEAQFFHSINFAILNLLSSLSRNDSILLKRSQLLDIQASIQALEISQLTQNCDFNVLRDLQSKLRTSIDINLPP